MTKLIAYETGKELTGAPLRDRLIAEARKHREQDRYIAGEYYRNGTADWKGCAVGCSLRTLVDLKLYRPREKNNSTLGDHIQGERIGIPFSLWKLQDAIFEGLPYSDRVVWPEQFFTAIQCGADLGMVASRFMLRVLTDKARGSVTVCEDDSKAATLKVAALLRRRLKEDEPTAAQWRGARMAARNAESGSTNFYAGPAVDAADNDASGVAWWSGEIFSDADEDQYRWMRDVLLKMMRNAPMAVTP